MVKGELWPTALKPFNRSIQNLVITYAKRTAATNFVQILYAVSRDKCVKQYALWLFTARCSKNSNLWNSAKIISRFLAWGVHSLQTQTSWIYSKGSIANCGRMVTDSATVTMESSQETTIALSNGAIADPLRPPLPTKWGSHMPPWYANGHISATSDRYTPCLVLG